MYSVHALFYVSHVDTGNLAADTMPVNGPIYSSGAKIVLSPGPDLIGHRPHHGSTSILKTSKGPSEPLELRPRNLVRQVVQMGQGRCCPKGGQSSRVMTDCVCTRKPRPVYHSWQNAASAAENLVLKAHE